jgi:hypothetical protein
MDPREPRFWLRIESGTHQDERVGIPPSGLSIGRRSSNQLTLEDPSVSGAHAEIRPDGEDLLLVDLGSTNGTKVGEERIETHRLAHGDRFAIGSVGAVFLDATLEGGSSAKVSEGASGGASGGGSLDRISADRVSASGRRGILGLLALLLLGAGAVVAWWLLTGSEAGTTAAEVPEVPGNLVADGTFEGNGVEVAWESSPTAPQSFFRDAGFASSGTRGFGAILEEGEWAIAFSPSFRIGSGSTFALRASLLAEEGAIGRLGVRYSSSGDDGPDFIVWSRTVAPAGSSPDFEEVELLFTGLPGYDRAGAVLAASAPGTGGGTVSADDLTLLPSEREAGAAAEFNEFEARLFGAESTSAVFVRSGRVLFCGVDFAAWGESSRGGWGKGVWSATASADGLDYLCAGSPDDAVLDFTINAASRNSDAETLLAAIGPGGYRSLASEFDVKSVESLLLGRGVNLIRIGFDEPIRMTGKVNGPILRLRAHPEGLDGFHLQLTFIEERIRAKDLAASATEAEARDRFGAALEAWNTLLDEVPFDVDLVARAEASRGRLVQQGMEEVEEIAEEIERARFFALTELYRQCRERAASVANAYGASDVAVAASVLMGEIDGELALLLARTPDSEQEKLRLVLEAIAPEKAPDLAAHLREVLGDATNDR